MAIHHCVLLKKPYAPLAVDFPPVCSSPHIFPLCSPIRIFHCIDGIWLFEEPTEEKSSVCPVCSRKLLKKPPIWGALIPPGLNAKAKKTWAPDTWLRTFSQALNLLTHPNFDTLKQHNWKGPESGQHSCWHIYLNNQPMQRTGQNRNIHWLTLVTKVTFRDSRVGVFNWLGTE